MRVVQSELHAVHSLANARLTEPMEQQSADELGHCKPICLGVFDGGLLVEHIANDEGCQSDLADSDKDNLAQ